MSFNTVRDTVEKIIVTIRWEKRKIFRSLLLDKNY